MKVIGHERVRGDDPPEPAHRFSEQLKESDSIRVIEKRWALLIAASVDVPEGTWIFESQLS